MASFQIPPKGTYEDTNFPSKQLQFSHLAERDFVEDATYGEMKSLAEFSLMTLESEGQAKSPHLWQLVSRKEDSNLDLAQ